MVLTANGVGSPVMTSLTHEPDATSLVSDPSQLTMTMPLERYALAVMPFFVPDFRSVGDTECQLKSWSS